MFVNSGRPNRSLRLIATNAAINFERNSTIGVLAKYIACQIFPLYGSHIYSRGIDKHVKLQASPVMKAIMYRGGRY